MSTMARSLGSSAGISVIQAGVISQTAMAHSVLAEHVQPSDPVYASVNPAFMNPADPLGIQILNGEIGRQAGMIAYDSVFGYMILMVLFMAPLLLLVRSPAAAAPIHVEVSE